MKNYVSGVAYQEPPAGPEYRPVPGFPGYVIGSDGSVWSSRQNGRFRQGRWRRLRSYHC
jgi:hypothetical protein